MARNKIIIVGQEHYSIPFQNLGETTTKLIELVNEPEKVSLVVFTGGEDIHPSYYKGIDKNDLCYSNIKRDRFEKRLFDHCREHKLKMTGICRGFQFLNVMAGGFMYHHLEDHALMGLHSAYFAHLNSTLFISSTHHQLVGLRCGSVPIAWTNPRRSSFYVGPKGQILTQNWSELPKEIEAAIFPKINAMGVQYHPEMMSEKSQARIHYESMADDFIQMDMQKFVAKYGGKKKDGRRLRKARGV